MELDRIKTKDDLKKILKFLDEQGFGYISEYELHNNKIRHIINRANTLGLEKGGDLTEKIGKLNDYEEAEKIAKEHFSKFDAGHKINEYINKFYLSDREYCSTPSYTDDVRDIIAWVEFKRKNNIKEDFGYGQQVGYYNLDKNYLKVNYSQYSNSDFKRFYELIFNEKCADFDEPGRGKSVLTSSRYGEWKNIGKIDIKFFQNGSLNIKGDIDKLKQYYYNYLIKHSYNNTIIVYNKKETILKKQRED